MPKIELVTEIFAPIEICFDLARSIDLHQISTANTSEKAIAGVTTGLIGLNEYVTWEAVHFGIKQQLSSKITAFNKPYYFVDEQMEGAFKVIYHQHKFSEADGKVLMLDIFEFSAPYGVFGRIFNALILTNYLKKLLLHRNEIIKNYAETDKWKSVLNETHY
ncbi:MAG: SRPBCC family protein [Pedobacter sp.]